MLTTDAIATGDEAALTHALYEHAQCGLLVTGSDGTIRRVNATFCNWIGYEPDALVGRRRLQDLLTVGGRIFHQTHWFPLLDIQGSVAEVKLDIIHRDGSVIPMILNAVRRIAGAHVRHEIALFVAQDRNKYERELLLARKRAEELAEKEHQAQRLLLQRTELLEKANFELRGFTQSLAHDLRGPITTISVFSGKLEKILSEAGDKNTRHLVQRTRLAAIQMADYMDALLKLAGLSQVELAVTDVDLSALALGALAGLQKRDPHRAVRLNVQENLQVRGDARLLGLMMDHLLDNAWKFTAPCKDAEISFTAFQKAQSETCYCVQDNGVGFNQAYVDKLFGNFQRLHSPDEFPGMGMGLASVARVVSRHLGRIKAESAEGRGATFTFTLRADL